MKRSKKIVLTGGPGGGKTTAANLFRRELGERVVVVPEAGTMLFGGGFPRHDTPPSRMAAQRAIFEVQRSLEAVQTSQYPSRVLLCDRGTVDGAAYWPEGPDAFFSAMGSSYEEEMQRYDAVVFFETAAAGELSIEGGNPVRTETRSEAKSLDEALQEIWRSHPNFYFVPHQPSFLAKVTNGLHELFSLVDDPPKVS